MYGQQNFRIGSFYKIQAILLRTNQAKSMENSLYCENGSPSARREISYFYGKKKSLTSKTRPVLRRVNSLIARKRRFFEALKSTLGSPK